MHFLEIKNVALHQQTTQTTTYNLHGSNRAVDGKHNSNLGGMTCSHTRSEAINCLTVYFNETVSIEYINIFNRLDCCSERMNNANIYVYNKSGSPVKILFKDRFLQIILFCWILTFFIIIYLNQFINE